jgi:hypothetical protein
MPDFARYRVDETGEYQLDSVTRLPLKARSQSLPATPHRSASEAGAGAAAAHSQRPVFLDTPSDEGPADVPALRAQGYPFMVSSSAQSVTSSLSAENCAQPGGTLSVTVVDSPGFGDLRRDTNLEFKDSSICAALAGFLSREDLPMRGVTAILLFVGNSTREDTTLARQMLVLQLSFGPEVWRRVVFVFRASSESGDTVVDVARCSEIVRTLLEKITRGSGAFDPDRAVCPVVLSRTDTSKDVMRKVLWALEANQVLHTSRALLTYGATTCKKCGATHDKHMVEALARCGEVAMQAAVRKCHPGFKQATLDVGSRAVAGVHFGGLGAATLPVYVLSGFLGWLLSDSWRPSDSVGVHPLRDWLMYAPRTAASAFHGKDLEVCVKCQRSRNSVGCEDVTEGGLQHEFHSPPEELFQ